jgi:hypothetical protein
MAHFARIENNIVREVIVVNNEILKDANGIEQESIGAQFCHDTFGGEWKQTSYNATFRGRYAGSGMIYDPVNNVFTSPALSE